MFSKILENLFDILKIFNGTYEFFCSDASFCETNRVRGALASCQCGLRLIVHFCAVQLIYIDEELHGHILFFSLYTVHTGIHTCIHVFFV